MKRKNLFDGDSYRAQFSLLIYERLLTRQWFTLSDVMADFMSKGSPEELPYSISKCPDYGELKKAFGELKRYIEERVGPGAIEEDGNNRKKRFRYVGKVKDPLEDIKNAKIINDLRQYWKFCQDSAGFFPTAWLEYFFKDCQDWLDIKAKRSKGEQFISSSIDRQLKNIELLPFLYEAIDRKQVLEILYEPFGKELESLLFSPHYLREFNGRWFLLGHADGMRPEFGYNLPLDRIVGKPREISRDVAYIPAPPNYYVDFFRDIVGVSHHANCEVEDVVFRAKTLYMFNLIDTLPIHASQKVLKPFAEYEDGSYGEFSVRVEVNDEFIGLILQKGESLELCSPATLRAKVANRVKNMLDAY